MGDDDENAQRQIVCVCVCSEGGFVGAVVMNNINRVCLVAADDDYDGTFLRSLHSSKPHELTEAAVADLVSVSQ